MLRWFLVCVLSLTCMAHVRSDEPAGDIDTEWKTLVQELTDFKSKAEDLKVKYSKATAGERSKIEKEFMTMQTRLFQKVVPRMQELAPTIYKNHPDDTVAAELLLQSLFLKNQYEEIQKITDGVLKKDPKAQMALNYSGIAKFANHDFAGALKTLQTAQSSGLLMDGLAGPYLEASQKYVKYWEEEQAIRAQEDAATGDALLPIVKLETSRGDIEILMLENEAPNTVANFISLVEAKFYDGLKFHRVIPGFMDQAGCPNSRDNIDQAGSGGPGYVIDCECYSPKARRHFSGSLSMAHAGKGTGGSQFFLTHLPTDHLNPEEGKVDGTHTVFGRVIKGLDVVRAVQKGDVISHAVVVRKRNHEYKPVTSPDPTEAVKNSQGGK